MELRGSPILQIAQSLFGQMRAFGILANHSARAAEILNSSILPRLALLKMLLTILDRVDPEGCRPSIASGDPIIYNTLDWPPTASPAGEFEPSGDISLEQHLNTWFLSWNLQLGEHAESAMALKIVRAALWLVDGRGGIASAIHYVINLQVKGVIVNRLAAIQAMVLLLKARRCIDNDTDLAAFFLESAPSSTSEWTRAQFKEFNLDKPFVRPELTDDLSILLDRADNEVDRVLDAETYDQWLLGQLSLHPVLSTVVSVFHELHAQNELQFVTKLTRLEEIRADAGGFGRLFRLWSSKFISFKYASDFTMSRSVCSLLSGKTEDWKDRVLDERAVVPTCLQELVTDRGITSHSLPDGWERISETLVPIAGPTLFGDDEYLLSRTELFEPDDIQNAPSFAVFLRSIGTPDDSEVKKAVVQLLCMQGPTASEISLDGLSVVERLEAIAARFNRQFVKMGWEDMPREAVDLFRSAAKLDLAEAESALRAVYKSICVDEISGFIDQAFEAGTTSSALECLDKLCDLYPYFHPGQVERAVQLDQDGQANAALDCMLKAIIMEPREALRWQSLGVILERLGKAGDARLAHAVAEIIKDDVEKKSRRR